MTPTMPDALAAQVTAMGHVMGAEPVDLGNMWRWGCTRCTALVVSPKEQPSPHGTGWGSAVDERCGQLDRHVPVLRVQAAREGRAAAQRAESPEPRAYTAEEAQTMLLDHLAALVRSWAGGDATPEAKLSGLVHSILTTFDGMSGEMPAFGLFPDPHPEDEGYHREQGENWWPSGPDAEDMAGSLRYAWSETCKRWGLP